MKVLYSEPIEKGYYRWMDNTGLHDIWYKDEVSIYSPNKEGIPQELKIFLEKWTEKIKEYKETYVEMYPVKLAEIKFIYQDIVYSINPYTVSATYMTNFLRDEYYEVEWDSLFETYQREIRDDLKKELGVKYSKYIGFLD